MPQSSKLPVLNLLAGQKSAFSLRRVTRCTDLGEIWTFRSLAQPRGTWVRLAVQNFTPIGARGGNMAQNGKILNPLTNFYNC